MEGFAANNLSIVDGEVEVACDDVDVVAEAGVVIGEWELREGKKEDGEEEEKDAHGCPWMRFKEIVCAIKCLLVNRNFTNRPFATYKELTRRVRVLFWKHT